MYTTKTVEEIKSEADKYSRYKLCYIKEIPGFSSYYKGSSDEWYESRNPDYVEGKQEEYAYFTPIGLDEQWGDDWDDYPYNHNADVPYDFSMVDGKRKEHEILVVPFFSGDYDVYEPKDWNYQNGMFSVKDINVGAVAWIYYAGPGEKTCKGSVVVKAGDSPVEFIGKIEKIVEGLYD